MVNLLANKSVLVHPNWNENFRQEVDTSNVGIGAVVSQNHGVIEYGSRGLDHGERLHSATEKELLPAVFFCRKV